MGTQSLLPAGHFRTTYAEDTVIFPTLTSRCAMLGATALLCVAPLALSQYWLSVLIQIGYLAIAALGLNILVGFTGQISIGHAAFFGLGAFTSAYLSAKLSVPAFFAIPLAALITAVAGLLFGLPAARLKGLYLAIATLAAQYILLDYRMKVSGATDRPLDALIKSHGIELQKLTSTELPRKSEWLGW
jgi:branched-chain amino acid transport system permease protein